MTAVYLVPIGMIGLGAVYGRIVVRRRVRRGDPPNLWRLEAVLGTAALGAAAGAAGAVAMADGSRRGEVGGVLMLLSAFVFLGRAAWIACWTRGDGWLSPPSRRRSAV